MFQIALLADLAAFTIVVSQPLFYLVSLAGAQRSLSAPAYIELRQGINPIMNQRVPVIYGGALLSSLLLIATALRADEWLVLATAIVALACLIADVVFMLRENVPINRVVDQWSTTEYPPDWATYRDRWLSLFATRQLILLLGFSALLVGTVFR